MVLRDVDLKIGLGVAWNKILWGVDSGLRRGKVGSLEHLCGGSPCLRQPIKPRYLPLSASILAHMWTTPSLQGFLAVI